MVWILPFVLLAQEVLSRQEPVYSPDALRARIQGTVVLSYRIAKDGSVEDIETVSGHPALVIAAGTNLATWRFHSPSSSSDKRSVTYVFEIVDGGKAKTEFQANDIARVTAPPYDPVKRAGCPPTPVDPPKAELQDSDFIELSRTSCYGSCPVYTLKLLADGRVIWKGEKFVASVGTASHRIEETAVKALLERFRSSEVWSLCESYHGPEFDHATVRLRINIGGTEKAVSEYAFGAPRWFTALRSLVDDVAETHDLMHGSPLDEPLDNIRYESPAKRGVTDLMIAARFSDVTALLAKGANANAQDASGWSPLMYAAATGNAKAKAELLRAGADPKHVSKRGETVLMADATRGYFDDDLAKLANNINAQDRNGMTVLMYLVGHGGRIAEIQAAIAAGADIGIRDKQGRTALHYVNRDLPELRRLLSGK